MGWVATVCYTIVAGFILYKLFLQSRASRENLTEKKSASEQGSILLIPTAATEEVKPGSYSTLIQPVKVNINVPLMQVWLAQEESPPEVAGSTMSKNHAMLPPPPLPKLSRPTSPPRLNPPRVGASPAPPRPGNGFVRPPPSAASSLRVPITKPLPNASLAPTSSIMPPGKQVSRKVILEPGHSPLDWAALANNPNSHLRGKDAPGENMLRVTPTQLKKQNGRKGRDAWTVYQGKVYNLSPYVPFHPGGAGEILRGAGKDSVKLFMEVHPWVNWDGMLNECLVGILVGEEDASDRTHNNLDEMD